MSFLDSLKSTAKNLGDKAADTAEIAKLKMKISSAESDIKSIYTEMGKKLFEEHPEYLGKFFTEEKGKIDELTANIAALKDRIEAVKNTVGKVEDTAAASGEDLGGKVDDFVDAAGDKAEDILDSAKDKIEEAL